MNKLIWLDSAALVVLIAVTGSSCGGDDEPSGLAAKLRLDDGRTTFQLGEPIQMQLELTNRTSEAIRLAYEDPKEFGFAVISCGGDDCGEVWSWPTAPIEASAAPERVMQPGEQLKFETRWNQFDSSSKLPVAPGDYQAGGFNYACSLATSYECESSEWVSFEVRD